MKSNGWYHSSKHILIEYSLLLIIGTLVAFVWANWGNHELYARLTEWQIGSRHGESEHHVWNAHFIVNGVLMSLFFFIAAKEVRESFLPGGDLQNPRTAALPIVATVGGMAGPACIFVAGCMVIGAQELMRGWAVPCATDIAFSYLVGKVVFGKNHAATRFLLLLAIVDDALGLIILATCYPSASLNFYAFFGFVGSGIATGLLLRRLHFCHWVPYVFGAGTLSWLGFYYGGFEPALGLVPIVITLPHAHHDLGIFAKQELGQLDTLNRAEHALKPWVEGILGLFGFVNVGVEMSSVGKATALVAGALLIGKPLGIIVFVLLGKALRLTLPSGMSMRHVIVLGFAASIGFTVSLFVATVAFKPGLVGITSIDLDGAKMGALLSFGGVILTMLVAWILGVRPLRDVSE